MRNVERRMGDDVKERQRRFREKNVREGTRELRLWVPVARASEIRAAVERILTQPEDDEALAPDKSLSLRDKAGQVLLAELLAEPTRQEKLEMRAWIAIYAGEGDPMEVPAIIVMRELAQRRKRKCEVLGIPTPTWARRLTAE